MKHPSVDPRNVNKHLTAMQLVKLVLSDNDRTKLQTRDLDKTALKDVCNSNKNGRFRVSPRCW